MSVIWIVFGLVSLFLFPGDMDGSMDDYFLLCFSFLSRIFGFTISE